MEDNSITDDNEKVDLLAKAMKPAKMPISHGSTDEVSSDTISLGNNDDVVEETFGTGANKRVLLVTKGISLKNIVAASR